MTFVSYAQNFEDVLLWRALGRVERGCYIDVGAAHPDIESVTRAFYDRGWSGINIEPVASHAQRLALSRPRDINLQLAVGERAGLAEFFVVAGTGLSTLDSSVVSGYGDNGFDVAREMVEVETLREICRQHVRGDIHFLKVDVEGAERAVLAGADFATWRPWIVLVEATAPMSTREAHGEWEPILAAGGYRFVWFDGLNRFYLAEERHHELGGHFRTPPNVFDDFLRAADTEWARRIAEAQTRLVALEQRVESAERRAAAGEERAAGAFMRLSEEARATAVMRAIADERSDQNDALRRELAVLSEHHRVSEAWLSAMRGSTSWRVTAPLRRAMAVAETLRRRSPVPVAAAGETASSEMTAEVPVEPAPTREPTVLPPLGTSRLTRIVHQFHSGSAEGDAITNAMLLTRRVLRELGYVSDIFVEHRDPRLAEELRTLDELPTHPDYVLIVRHSMGYDGFEHVAALPARKVLLYHNITPPEFLPAALHGYARLGRAQLAAWRPRVIAALADSEYNALELRRLGFEAVQACALLFDIKAMQEAAAEAALRRPPAANIFTILFVGRVIASKCQDDLIAAYAAFRAGFERPSRLVLIGRHDGASHEFLTRIDTLIRARDLQAHVMMTGHVSDEELHDWYHGADLYVSLSQHEGFGVPLVEAMVHGVPVLAWPSGAVPYTIADAGEVLSDRAPEAVGAAMRALARNPAHLAVIRQRQSRALDRFALDRHLPRLVRALALAGAPPPRDLGARTALLANLHVTLFGHLNKTYSLAAINRTLGRAMEAEWPGRTRLVAVEGAVTDDLCDVPATSRAAIAALTRRAAPATGPHIVISHHYPIFAPPESGDLPVALFFWEESVVPRAMLDQLETSFRGVLAPSAFVAKALTDSGCTLPVRNIAYAPDVAAFAALPRAPRDRSGLTFLHVSSLFPRKGVDVLLAAWARAFRVHHDVRLLIKGFPNPHNDAAEQIAALQAAHPSLAPITLIDRDLEQNELLELYGQADVVVLPTRGEGFNLPVAEAMAAGIPVIVTGYGGHMDFCTPENARLVDYRFAPSQSHLATPGSVWVEPDMADLANAMTEALARRSLRGPARLSSTSGLARRVGEVAIDLLLAPLPEKLRLAWISSWSVRCGIAEYSRQLLEAMPPATRLSEISILCDQRTDPDAVGLREAHIQPVWRIGDPAAADRLAEAIATSDPAVVVIQHQPALFSWGVLATLLSAAALRGRVVSVTLHNTRDLLVIGEAERHDVLAALAKAARVMVHTVADLNLLKGFGLVRNVTMLPQGVPIWGGPPRPSPPALALDAGSAPMIGSYGFCLPGKGIPQLIEAAVRLRQSWPRLRLRLVTAEHDVAASRDEIAACHALIRRAGLEEAVELITDFLPHERSLALLSECDLVVLPYQESLEASSAALRTALASGTPVLVTPLALFEEAEAACARCEDLTPAAIAAAAAALLGDAPRRARLQEAASAWTAGRAWPLVAQRFTGMLVGLASQGDAQVPEATH